MKIYEREIEISKDYIKININDFNEYVDAKHLILEENELVTLIDKSINLANLRGGFVSYTNFVFDEKNFLLEIEKIPLNINKKIFKSLKKSEIISIILCTAGEGITELIRQFNESGDYLRGYIVDLIGSIIVEKVADYIHNLIRVYLKKNITNRYSPGYCGWPTSDQFNIFKLIPEYFCGIKLNERGLMIPIKSISGIVGSGENVKYISYECNACNDKNCIYRRIKS